MYVVRYYLKYLMLNAIRVLEDKKKKKNFDLF